MSEFTFNECYRVLHAATFHLARTTEHLLKDHVEAATPGARGFVFDYFCHCPLSHCDAEVKARTVCSLAPFIPWLSRHNLAVPKVDEHRLTYWRPCEREMAALRFDVPLGHTNFCREVFRLWQKCSKEDAPCPPGDPTYEGRTRGVQNELSILRDLLYTTDVSFSQLQYERVSGRLGYTPVLLVRLSPEQLRRSVQRYRTTAAEDVRTAPDARAKRLAQAKLLQAGFLLTQLGSLFSPWALPDAADIWPDIEIPIVMLLIPIASNRLFYGFRWAWIVGPSKEAAGAMSVEQQTWRNHMSAESLAQKLVQQTCTEYVPALAILHQSFVENILAARERDGMNAADLVRTLMSGSSLRVQDGDTEHRYYLPFRKTERSDCPIEVALQSLWYGLAHSLDELEPGDWKMPKLFKKYNVSSPEMVRVIIDTCERAVNLRPSGKELPSALVIGGPGSGK